MATTVRHEPEHSRFVADVDGDEAMLEYRVPEPGTREYYHTFVPPAARGRGIAGDLVRFALEDARSAGVRVIPSCPFVARFTSRDTSFADVLVD